MNKADFHAWCINEFPSIPSPSSKPLVMGILNLTPDSFSDGGRFLALDDALYQAQKLVDEGADLLDIGGESSRPFRKPVSVDEELARVLPFLERFSTVSDICCSIDTVKAEVMQAALSLGVGMVNDIRALESPGTLPLIAAHKVPVVLMHMQGDPQTMQLKPDYPLGVCQAVDEFFLRKIESFESHGLKKELIILDPGFGFGKTVSQNLALLNNLELFCKYRRPLLIGLSKKSMIGALLNEPLENRMVGGLILSALAFERGALIFRTHDVAATKKALHLASSVLQQ